METTMKAVYIALQVAPLLALLLFLPHAVIRYVRQKSLNVRRSTYLYVFLLYFLCAYFMTMLPLPSRDSFVDMRPVRELIQLIPFQNFLDIRLETVFRDVAILLFNVLLTVPLGFFLRFLFGFSMKKTVLFGFLTAMLYEVTQLTGIFFIYPRPYRIFDVDDLIINTLGALVGYLICPLARRILPDPDRGSPQLVQGSEASFPHRCVAEILDFCLVLCATVALILLPTPLRDLMRVEGSLWRFPVFYLLFLTVGAAYSFLLRGGTAGVRLTGLRLMNRGGSPASRGRCALRLTILHGAVIAIPYWVYFFMTVHREYRGVRSILWVLLAAVLMMCAASILLEMSFNAVTHGSSMFYDRLLGTYVAYGSSRKTSLFGIRVIDVQPLSEQKVDDFSREICQTLGDMEISGESITRVRLMAEGVMLDWIEEGLGGRPCELRLDHRFKRSALMLSVPGEDQRGEKRAEGYAEMLSGLDLTLKTYYAGEKNICIIQIPPRKKF